MSSYRRRAIFCAITGFLVLVLLEITLNVLAFVSPRVDWLLALPSASDTIPDKHLGYRPHPGHPEHDLNGYRNPDVPDQAHIVALGDSQVYGTGVKPTESWPRQLESMIGVSVYSMAFGGYGPTHSLMLWKDAIALSPQIIIASFYAGNDLFDSFDHVYNLSQLTDLKSHDPSLQTTIWKQESVDPIADRVTRMFRMGSVEPETLRDSQVSPFDWVTRSKLFGLLRRGYYEATKPASITDAPLETRWLLAKSFAEWFPEYCQVFDNGNIKTIITSKYRLSALDLNDSRISEGLSISLRAINKMSKRARSMGVRFIVLLMPTKATVFSYFPGNSDQNYINLVSNEMKMWETAKGFLEQKGIEYLDALPVLQRKLSTGVQPYRVSQDGHPNRVGHRSIARLIAEYLYSPEASRPGRAPEP